MDEQRIEKTVTVTVGTICSVIATALISLLVLMITARPEGSDHLEKLALLISVVAPFALVFSAFGWGIFSRSVQGKFAMYSPTGWRVLAFLSAAIGLVCAVLSGPLALLLPGVLALVLLSQDEWLRALLLGGRD
jgi:O-antigen/teichoic acid export membrane protein